MTRKTFILLFVVIINCFTAKAQEFLKGPYLILTGNTNEMMVLWQSSTNNTSILRWELYDGSGKDSITLSEDDATHLFRYTITGLIPENLYNYSVDLGDTIISSTFKAPHQSMSTSFSFYVMGDTRSYPARTDSLSNAILLDISDDPSSQTFLVHTGDFNSADGESNWQNEYFNRSYISNLAMQSKLPIMGVRGNHESTGENFHRYFPYDTSFYYSVDYGGVHICMVDQYINYSSGSVQNNWILNDMSITSAPFVFFAFHEPAYTDGGAHSNNTLTQQEIVPILLSNNVKVVFNGHNHFYSRCLVDGINHATVGGGGAPTYIPDGTGTGLVYSEACLCYAKITVSNDSTTVVVKKQDRSVIDSFVLYPTPIFPSENSNPISFKVIQHNETLVFDINSNHKEDLFIRLFDVRGREVEYKNVSNKSSHLDYQLGIGALSKGVYIVEVSDKNYSEKMKILIK